MAVPLLTAWSHRENVCFYTWQGRPKHDRHWMSVATSHSRPAPSTCSRQPVPDADTDRRLAKPHASKNSSNSRRRTISPAVWSKGWRPSGQWIMASAIMRHCMCMICCSHFESLNKAVGLTCPSPHRSVSARGAATKPQRIFKTCSRGCNEATTHFQALHRSARGAATKPQRIFKE